MDKLLSERLILEMVHLIDIDVPAEIDKYSSLGITARSKMDRYRYTDRN